jgi:molybdate transport system permease protein
MAAVDRRLLNASAGLGASPRRSFWRIIVPLSLPGIVTGFALSFAHTLGEFGVVLMLGGNIAGRTRTASIAIYDDVQALDYASAARQSLILLAISFTLLVAIYTINRRRGWRLQ